MADNGLDDSGWRVFQLALLELEDEQLELAYGQLLEELEVRRQQETSAMRLLFSSMTAGELETARQVLLAEQEARVEDLRILGLINAAGASAGGQRNNT